MIVMNDFKKEYAFFKQNIDAAFLSVMESGWYILGPKVEEFEKVFAEYIGVPYCIGVANGLEAIQITLMALHIGKGDEVLTVSHSAVATTLAITNVGATPVFVDIDEYYHMDASTLESYITPRTKAIVPVHLYGQALDMDTINEVAKKHNLAVIEDACQAAGAEFHGKKTGSMGVFGCFSFYPTKNLGGYGDGGAITTSSPDLYQKCKMLRNYGQRNRYHHEIQGINSRLDELQAAILLAKLPRLDECNKKRNEFAQIYLKELAGVSQIVLPKLRDNSFHIFHLFVIEAEKRDELMKFLSAEGVQSLIHYPVPIHKQQCYSEYNNVTLKNTEEKVNTILSLPMHPFMEEGEVVKVCDAVKKFYAAQG
ncbi:MAG: hypothetical protein RI947_816 [Candidatus Parcubacteria bacterium]|jgi:dTDP-4-amino-4,6-dideoxygalactose transaminase